MERCAATEVLLEALDNINNLEVLRVRISTSIVCVAFGMLRVDAPSR
jgi:hypothetical protein